MNSSLTNSSSSTPVATCVAAAAARLRAAASTGLPKAATPTAEGSVAIGGGLAKAGLFISIATGAGGGVSQAAPPPPPLPPARRRSMYCSPRQAAMARTPAEVTTIVQLRENSSWKRNRIRRGEKLLLRSRPV
jgi:hypothetical protein